MHGLVDQHFKIYEEIKKCLDEWIISKDEFFLSQNLFIARKVRKSH